MSSILSSTLSSTAQAAHAAATSLLAANQIAIGASLLETAQGKKVKPSGGADQSLEFSEKLASGKVVIVGVPGAFTPPCSSQVPGYLAKAEEFFAKGISAIYIVAVNDAFVVQAWKEKLTEGKDTRVQFIADDQGTFVGSLGLLFDASPLLGGPRSKRFVIVADNGKVTHVAVEQDPPEITVTKAEAILAQL
ncbi:hypothetical protein ACEPAF_1975 [Sanghuangporus sanghuang]